MGTIENGHASAQEAEHASLKYQIQNLIKMAEETNAACSIVSLTLDNGYNASIVIRRAGAYAYDEFTPDQIKFIRQLMKEQIIEKQHTAKQEVLEDMLDLLNVCQAKLECGEYGSISELVNDDSDNWRHYDEEPEEEWDDEMDEDNLEND